MFVDPKHAGRVQAWLGGTFGSCFAFALGLPQEPLPKYKNRAVNDFLDAGQPPVRGDKHTLILFMRDLT